MKSQRFKYVIKSLKQTVFKLLLQITINSLINELYNPLKSTNCMRYKQRLGFITFLREIPQEGCLKPRQRRQVKLRQQRQAHTLPSEFYECLILSWAPSELHLSFSCFPLGVLQLMQDAILTSQEDANQTQANTWGYPAALGRRALTVHMGIAHILPSFHS
jgi:hypothetical protein